MTDEINKISSAMALAEKIRETGRKEETVSEIARHSRLDETLTHQILTQNPRRFVFTGTIERPDGQKEELWRLSNIYNAGTAQTAMLRQLSSVRNFAKLQVKETSGFNISTVTGDKNSLLDLRDTWYPKEFSKLRDTLIEELRRKYSSDPLLFLTDFSKIMPNFVVQEVAKIEKQIIEKESIDSTAPRLPRNAYSHVSANIRQEISEFLDKGMTQQEICKQMKNRKFFIGATGYPITAWIIAKTSKKRQKIMQRKNKSISQKSKKLPFEEARTFVRKIGLKKNWRDYAKSGSRPANIPSNPWTFYKKEWISMQDWLGIENSEKPIGSKAFRKYVPANFEQEIIKMFEAGKNPREIVESFSDRPFPTPHGPAIVTPWIVYLITVADHSAAVAPHYPAYYRRSTSTEEPAKDEPAEDPPPPVPEDKDLEA